MLLLTGMGLLRSWMDQVSLSINQQRISAIQQALTTYAQQNNSLPQPASFKALPSSLCFGRMITTTDLTLASCKVGPSSGVAYSEAGGKIMIGALPVRELGLPDSYSTNSNGYS